VWTVDDDGGTVEGFSTWLEPAAAGR
jgi:hypothetical protein